MDIVQSLLGSTGMRPASRSRGKVSGAGSFSIATGVFAFRFAAEISIGIPESPSGPPEVLDKNTSRIHGARSSFGADRSDKPTLRCIVLFDFGGLTWRVDA